MKLIYCPECNDVKRVWMLRVRHCACGKSWGYYLQDDLTAEMGGSAVPLAIANDELREAADRRPETGQGVSLEARVLPVVYETLRHRDEPGPVISRSQEPT